MDSLIVLRKPLRKTTPTPLEPKFKIQKKTKKTVVKVVPIPLNPDMTENEAPISFVKLYKDLCVENSRRTPTCEHTNSPTRVYRNTPARFHHNEPARVHVNEPARALIKLAQLDEMHVEYRHVNSIATSRSDTSLVTQYRASFGTDPRVFTETPPPGSAQAELILELDYDSCFKDSGFY